MKRAMRRCRRERVCKDCGVVVNLVGEKANRWQRCEPCHERRQEEVAAALRADPAHLRPNARCIGCGVELASKARRKPMWCQDCLYSRHQKRIRMLGEAFIRRNGDAKLNYCQTCGRDCKPHRHHFAGYDGENALKVIWLCASCHRAADAENHRALLESA
jgi:hypothetical protein